MEKNYLRYTCVWSLIVLVGLLLMHCLPSLMVRGHHLRRVDLLSDVRPPGVVKEDSDSLLPPPSKPAFVDTCREGLTCIEDYGDSTGHGMLPFYHALDELKDHPRLVRIAVFGDSFIEADILTSDLREMLQKKYGGCGVGFVDITSTTNGYRPTVRHSFGGWKSHAIMDSTYFDRAKQGISNRYFVPHDGAYVELRGQTHYASRLDTCERASIFFYNEGNVTLSATINNGRTETRDFAPVGKVQTMEVVGRIGRVRWTVDHADSTLFYGVAADGEQGVLVDNFSMRGNSGLSLRSIPVERLKAFNALRPYDLIILEYGLNVATERGRNYDKYRDGMRTAISHLKKAFPGTGILLLSVGDRDYKTEDGELRTMPGIRNLIRYQQNMAADNGIAFWNMFEAMGGNGSMVEMVNAKPSLANYDYTHINFRGGKHLAGLLYDALVYGKERYDRRRAYEAQ